MTTENPNLITDRTLSQERDLSSERWQSYQKLKAENAYAEDAESYLVAKEQKRKNIAKIVKAEKAKGIIRR
ncbi:MAG: hypothetical protein ABFC94_06025 [Syntrophomonas sp.]